MHLDSVRFTSAGGEKGDTLRIRLTRPRVALLAVGAAAVVAGTAGSLGSAHAASGRQAIPNTRPAWLGHAKNLGHASARASVSARIYLAPNGGMAKLEQFALAVSTPGNAQYRHFLKPSRYFQRFGTTNSAVVGGEILADRSRPPRHRRRAAQPLCRDRRHGCGGRESIRRVDQPLPAQRSHGAGADGRAQRTCRRGFIGADGAGRGHDADGRSSGDAEAAAARAGIQECGTVLDVLRREARHDPAGVQRAHPPVRAVRLHRPAVPRRLRGQRPR